MKKNIRFVLIGTMMLLAAVFVANAQYGNYAMDSENMIIERGTYHESMEPIVEEGTFEDLETFRNENGGFGGPRWVTDEASFQTWQEMHEQMEESGYEPGYMMGSRSGSGRGQDGRVGGCPMRGGY